MFSLIKVLLNPTLPMLLLIMFGIKLIEKVNLKQHSTLFLTTSLIVMQLKIMMSMLLIEMVSV